MISEAVTRGDAAVEILMNLRDPASKFARFVRNLESAGAAHVAGLNFSAIGSSATCIGCHAGHSMLDFVANIKETVFTNLATGAVASASSSASGVTPAALIDRRAAKSRIADFWRSAPGLASGQWVELRFPVPVVVRTVRLYGPRQSDGSDGEAPSSLRVLDGAVTLLRDSPLGSQSVAFQRTGELSPLGTDVPFPLVTIDAVRFEFGRVSGTINGALAASLAEIEVIARGAMPDDR
jgi:hypothetical protein